MIGPGDLVLSHFSLGRFLPFEERVAAAAGAGFAGIGLYYGDYQRLRAEGASDADLRAILAHHGLELWELEALRGWTSTGAALEESRALEEQLYAIADAFGTVHHFQVLGPYEGTVDEAVEAFAVLCDRAAEHGLGAAIEFLPEMTNIPDAGTAWEIARLAGRPNGGLCVDSWHHFRGAADLAMLAEVPAAHIIGVQLDDGPRVRVEADYYRDCTENRLPCGQGDFDLTSFLRTLAGMGVAQPFSIEVLSTELLTRPHAEVAQLLAETARSVLAASA